MCKRRKGATGRVSDHVSVLQAQAVNKLIFFLECLEPVAAGFCAKIHAFSFVEYRKDPREEKAPWEGPGSPASGFC